MRYQVTDILNFQTNLKQFAHRIWGDSKQLRSLQVRLALAEDEDVSASAPSLRFDDSLLFLMGFRHYEEIAAEFSLEELSIDYSLLSVTSYEPLFGAVLQNFRTLQSVPLLTLKVFQTLKISKQYEVASLIMYDVSKYEVQNMIEAVSRESVRELRLFVNCAILHGWLTLQYLIGLEAHDWLTELSIEIVRPSHF